MSSPDTLPQAIALATRMSLQELDLLAIVVGALARDARSKDPGTYQLNPVMTVNTDLVKPKSLRDLKPGVITYQAAPKRKRRPRVMKRRTYVPREGTPVAKVWEALQQSSGELTAQDLAVLLDLPGQKVSHALHELTRKKSTIKVNKVKMAQDDGSVRRVYKYQYVGKARAA